MWSYEISKSLNSLHSSFDRTESRISALEDSSLEMKTLRHRENNPRVKEGISEINKEELSGEICDNFRGKLTEYDIEQ